MSGGKDAAGRPRAYLPRDDDAQADAAQPGFLQRWSRRKIDARQGKPLPAEADADQDTVRGTADTARTTGTAATATTPRTAGPALPSAPASGCLLYHI